MAVSGLIFNNRASEHVVWGRNSAAEQTFAPERGDNEKAKALVAVGLGPVARVASLFFAGSWGHVFCVGDEAKDAEVNGS